jgi:tripartite-type tricarboxylate transporter receptor subunit TctC
MRTAGDGNPVAAHLLLRMPSVDCSVSTGSRNGSLPAGLLRSMQIAQRFVAATAMVSLLMAAGVHAESYPVRPIRLIVPQSPGGTVDLTARVFAERLRSALNATIVVENKPGAGGAIGCDFVAHAAPDGYTLLAASTNTHALLPHVQASVGYDALRDFAPIVNLVYTTSIVAVTPSLPVHTLSELIAYVRANPGKLNYPSTGVGSSDHIDTELFKSLARIDLVHIPYRGAPQTIEALVTGEVQVGLVAIGNSLGPVEAGQLRPLAVLSDQRSSLLPEVPTAAEAGLPELKVRFWVGLVAPAGTPPEIISVLNGALQQGLGAPNVRQWIASRGLEPVGGSPSDFAEEIRVDYANWGEVIKRIGLKSQ